MRFEIITSRPGIKHIDFGKQESTQSFYQLAYRIQTVLSIRYTKKTDNFNTLTWNYSYDGVPFHLHYHWDSGTRILLDSKAPTHEEEVVLEHVISRLREFLD